MEYRQECLSVLMSEIGNAKDLLNSFKSAKAFSPWLGLCPDNRISGGKILSSKTRKVVNRMSQALRMAAQGVANAHNAMGEYCRRIKAKLGKAEGKTAVTHKLARLIYAMVQTKAPYDEQKAFKVTAKSNAKKPKLIKKLAESLDMEVVDKQMIQS